MEKDISTLSAPSMIAIEWYKRGKSENDALFRFVSFWIVFIQLYNYNSKYIDAGDERRRIEDYCIQHYDALSHIIDFNADYMKPFKDNPVVPDFSTIGKIDCSSGKKYVEERMVEKLKHTNIGKEHIHFLAQDYYNICNTKSRTEWQIASLFNTIYQIRCNFFHGFKSPSPGRNYSLVESAAQILELCLPQLMKETLHVETEDLI